MLGPARGLGRVQEDLGKMIEEDLPLALSDLMSWGESLVLRLDLDQEPTPDLADPSEQTVREISQAHIDTLDALASVFNLFPAPVGLELQARA